MTKLPFLGVLVSISIFVSCFERKQKLLTYTSKLSIVNSIAADSIKVDPLNDCLPVRVSLNSGYLMNVDTSTLEFFVKPNSSLKGFSEDSVTEMTLRYCFAFFKADTLVIRFHESEYFETTELLDVKILDDSFSIANSYWNGEEISTHSFTKYQSLAVNKKHYSVGETIYGCLSYKGYHNTKYKRPRYYDGYFKCIVGKGANPLLHIGNYQKCKPTKF